jgi:hypothetical protein
MSLLFPFGAPNHALVPLGVDAVAIAACEKATAWIPAWAEKALGGVTALAAAGSGTLLVASGPRLFRLNITDPTAPVLESGRQLPRPLGAMRFDAPGKRAYALGAGTHSWPHGGDRTLIVDLRSGGLDLAGSHAVPHWVERRDAGDLSLRIAKWHQAQLAKVAR